MSTHQTPSSTINLPRELRDKIYRELLVPEKIRDPTEDVPRYALEPVILRTNKQTHVEAANVLYGENLWILFQIPYKKHISALDEPRSCRIFTSNIHAFPRLPALMVAIKRSSRDAIKKILVNYCDLRRFFTSVLDMLHNESPFKGHHDIRAGTQRRRVPPPQASPSKPHDYNQR